MPTEKKFKNKTCRYYKAGSVWVSQDGTVIAYVENVKDKQWGWPQTKTHYPRKLKRINGDVYFDNRFSYHYDLDKAVATCWCKPIPKDGKRYTLRHKDGNKQNCHAFNLEWILYHYENTTEDSVKVESEGVVLTIHKDGTIKKGKDTLTVYDYLYDSDTDLHRCISPYVSIRRERVHVEDLMKKAGYIQGDDANFIKPVILHIDEDSTNFASSNLEFCEATDPRYISYQQKRNEYLNKRDEELNPNTKIPECLKHK